MTSSAHEPSRATFVAVDTPTIRSALRRIGARPSLFATPTPMSSSDPVAPCADLILADADPRGRFASEAAGELCRALLK